MEVRSEKTSQFCRVGKKRSLYKSKEERQDIGLGNGGGALKTHCMVLLNQMIEFESLRASDEGCLWEF